MSLWKSISKPKILANSTIVSGLISASIAAEYRFLLIIFSDKTFLLYDTGHLLFAEANYQNVLNKYISRINHVHCKDIRDDVLYQSLKENLSFRNSFLNGVFTVPGDGCIDYYPILRFLNDNNYDKWLVIEAEQDPKKANPLEYAKIGYNYLIKILDQTGYEI